jgi:hypothetical protein
MVKSIRFTSEAEDDSYQGYAWYESQRVGLGREFITAVDACLQSISRNPKLLTIFLRSSQPPMQLQ